MEYNLSKQVIQVYLENKCYRKNKKKSFEDWTWMSKTHFDCEYIHMHLLNEDNTHK
jgi:hypothetical protein